MNALKAPQSVLIQLESLGLDKLMAVHYNLAPAALYQHTLQQHETHLAADGSIVACSAPYTGRSPRDRFIVKEPSTQDHICWGSVNVPISEAVFDNLLKRMASYAEDRALYVRDVFAGADPRYRLSVRAITEKAYHNLFIYNMFIRPQSDELKGFEPGFTILDLCDFKAVPERDGTRSEAFVIIHFAKKLVLIGGTGYAGEMKKSIFSILNFMLPRQRVLPMHCSANIGPDQDTAIFFGLSGTGKTTLSADASRTLIGDDEHAWTDYGVHNFEGGCYAKLIRLSAESEPEIYATTRRFGTVLENVVTDPVTHEIDFDDDSITENTRAAYPIHFISNASKTGRGGHPNHVIMLTADAFGVMPPIACLTPEQAMYHFLSGYTAKVAGTEKGITEPKATFSACFGEPFMVLHPTTYAELLGAKINQYNTKCWLINTGWTGGPYGVGSRMNLKYTRAMIHAVLTGTLEDVETVTDPVFGLAVPASVPGVPDHVLNPRSTWSDPVAYDMQAEKLADMFAQNFEKYADRVGPEILAAGPVEAEALR